MSLQAGFYLSGNGYPVIQKEINKNEINCIRRVSEIIGEKALFASVFFFIFIRLLDNSEAV